MNTPNDTTALGIEVGQQWRTRSAHIATVVERQYTDAHYLWKCHIAHPSRPEYNHVGYVTARGRFLNDDSPHAYDFVELLTDLPLSGFSCAKRVAGGERCDSHCGDDSCLRGGEIAPQPHGVGDVTSTAKGSGARYNASKPQLELVPLLVLAASLEDAYGPADLTLPQTPAQAAISALYELAAFQARGDSDHLLRAMDILGLYEGWEEAARVFDYGRRKYAEWNWAKGMAWSIPIACAARHLVAIVRGEHLDLDKPGAPGSNLPHRGHVFCNFAMLLCYEHTFEEGDDRAAPGLLPLLYGDEEVTA